ncbi:hypothetical protein [Streptomyces sp. enrichment culture]|uniref:hypothetical protein n=1 Tax=Streptomyces sp. enrichment culture TaxID=1795815 RepID=UPI003F54CBB9
MDRPVTRAAPPRPRRIRSGAAERGRTEFLGAGAGPEASGRPPHEKWGGIRADDPVDTLVGRIAGEDRRA